MPVDLCHGQHSQRALVDVLVDLLGVAHVPVEQLPVSLGEVELSILRAGIVPDLGRREQLGFCNPGQHTDRVDSVVADDVVHRHLAS